MKHKSWALVLILLAIGFSGCGVKVGEREPQAVDRLQAVDEPQAADEQQAAVESDAAPPQPATVANKPNAGEDQVVSQYQDFFSKGSADAVRMLSEAAASAVWQYGKELGWVDEHGGEFEDFYRVEWEANGSLDASSPFPYRLAGVLPMK